MKRYLYHSKHIWVPLSDTDHRVICTRCKRITTKRRTYTVKIAFENKKTVEHFRLKTSAFIRWHGYMPPKRTHSLHPLALFANLAYHLRYDRGWTVERIKKRFAISDRALDFIIIRFPWYPQKRPVMTNPPRPGGS